MRGFVILKQVQDDEAWGEMEKRVADSICLPAAWLACQPKLP